MLVCAWDSALGVAEQWCACRGQHLICITIYARTCHHLHMSPHPPTHPTPSASSSWPFPSQFAGARVRIMSAVVLSELSTSCRENFMHQEGDDS